MRTGRVERKTRETDLVVECKLDTAEPPVIETGVGFFDHMLTSMAFHGHFCLKVSGTGDLDVDAHHLVEDVGICVGQAIARALGDRSGIVRFGHAFVPMDEALVSVFLDISGRPYLAYGLELPPRQFGAFHSDLVEEFMRAFAFNSGITLHVRQEAGSNSHHIAEAAFKALGHALAQACAEDDYRRGESPSTKGVL